MNIKSFMGWINQQQTQYMILLRRGYLTEFGNKVHNPECQPYS